MDSGCLKYCVKKDSEATFKPRGTGGQDQLFMIVIGTDGGVAIPMSWFCYSWYKYEKNMSKEKEARINNDVKN